MTLDSTVRDEKARPIPERIGRYRPLSILGSGGMGIVYRAVDDDNQLVALKVMREEYAANSQMQRRFMREAAAGGRLYHPHIVRFLDFGVEDGHYYLAMELIEGISLWEWIPLAPAGSIVKTIIDQILSALAYAHARGVVHRDLKPENVLIERDRRGSISARLMDFGVVHFRDEVLGEAEAAEVIGTPEYISPEQAISADRVSPASDLYAVGILLWELLTGNPPYSGSTPIETIRLHLDGPRPLFAPRKEYAIDGPIESVLNRFLAREPSDRFVFAGDALRTFNECTIRGGRPADELPWGASTEQQNASRKRAYKPRPGIYAVSDSPYQNVRPELREMREFAENALREGHVRIILVTGPPGIGKTRLVQELGAELEESGLMQAWHGTSDDSGNMVVSIKEALQRGFGVYGLSREKADRRLREKAFQQGVDDPFEIDSLVNLVLDYEGARDGSVLLNEEARLAQVARLLNRARRVRPVLLCQDALEVIPRLFDSLHDVLRADGYDQFSAVIAYSIRTTRQEQVEAIRQFVEEAKRTKRARHLMHRHLEPLPVRSLQRIIVSSADIHPNLATSVASQSNGNPRRALEMVRSFSELPDIDLHSDEHDVGGLLASVPDAAAELAQRRLEKVLVGTDAQIGRRVLEVLACYNLEFSDYDAQDLIECILGGVGSSTVDAAITGAIAAGVLTEVRPGHFRFCSEAIRESLVERLVVVGERAEISLAIADFEQERAEYWTYLSAARVAERYRLGGNDTEAQKFFTNAGNQALREGRLHPARELLEQSLRLIGALPGAPSRTREANVLHSLARVYIRQDRVRDALELLDRVPIDELRFDDREVPTHWLVRAEWARHQGFTSEAEQFFQFALKTAILSGDRSLEAIIRMLDGQFMLAIGRLPEAEIQTRGALAANPQGSPEFKATCMLSLGFVALYAGVNDEAEIYLDRAIQLFDGRGSRLAQGTASMLEAELHFRRREFRESLSAYERARKAFDDIGDRQNFAITQLHRARALYALNSLELARQSVSSASEILREAGNLRRLAHGELIAARIEAADLHWEEARSRLAPALRFDHQRPIYSVAFVEELVGAAREWVVHGQYADARILLELCSEKLRRLGDYSVLSDAVDEVEYLLHVVQQA